MSGSNNREVGQKGEEEAAKFLCDNGYKIIKKNFHFGKTGEIDIIAEKDDILVFVEVKTRYNDKYGDPLLSITYRKQKSIRKVAEGYLYINKIRDKECRFDVIIVDKRPGINEIFQMENAF